MDFVDKTNKNYFNRRSLYSGANDSKTYHNLNISRILGIGVLDLNDSSSQYLENFFTQGILFLPPRQYQIITAFSREPRGREKSETQAQILVKIINWGQFAHYYLNSYFLG